MATQDSWYFTCVCVCCMSLSWWLSCPHPHIHPLTHPQIHTAVCYVCGWQCDSWLMASADYCTTTPQPASYTHTRTLSATTQLATVCVLPPSLQTSRSALRQGKTTHTHTHSSLLRSHIFWKGETRREQQQDSDAFFVLCNRIVVRSSRHFRDFLPRAESCFKDIWSIVAAKGICTISEPANRGRQKLGRRKKALDLCKEFWKQANMQWKWGSEKAGAMPKATSLKTLWQQLIPWALSMLSLHLWVTTAKAMENLRLSFQDLDATGPSDCADSALSICNINHIQCGGIQPGELSSNRHIAQRNHSPSGGEREAENSGMNKWWGREWEKEGSSQTGWPTFNTVWSHRQREKEKQRERVGWRKQAEMGSEMMR